MQRFPHSLISVVILVGCLAGCSPRPTKPSSPATPPVPARILRLGNAPAELNTEDQLRHIVLKQLAEQQARINANLPEERRDGAFYFAVDGRETPPSPALLTALQKTPSVIPLKSRAECEIPDGICVAKGGIRKGAILWISKLIPKPDGTVEFSAGCYRYTQGILSESLRGRNENGIWIVTKI